MDSHYFIKNGRVIAGKNGKAIEQGVVEVADGRICQIGSLLDGELPKDAVIVDAGGGTVIPGLIDSHIHVFHEAQMAKLSEGAAAIWGANYVQSALRAGLTTIRDLGSQTDAAFGLKRALREGWCVGPRYLVSGRALCMTGGHGWANLSIEADGPDGVRRAARQQLKAGADVVKLMASGGAGTPGELPTSAQFTVEEMRAAVEEAHAAGKPVAAHALATQGIINAIEAGADSIEHGVFLDDRCVELLLKHDVALCPTLSVYPRIIGRGPAGGEAPFVVEKSKPLVRPHLESIRKAVTAGVRIVFGTDATTLYNPMGAFDEEMALMAEAGMSAADIFRSATLTAAEVCGVADKAGTLEKGKCADIVIVGGNPIQDISALRNVKAVYRAGACVYEAGKGYKNAELVGQPVLKSDLDL